jgi:hypothetical protein
MQDRQELASSQHIETARNCRQARRKALCAGNRVDDNRASAHIGRQCREKIMVGSAIVMVGLAIVGHGFFHAAL